MRPQLLIGVLIASILVVPTALQAQIKRNIPLNVPANATSIGFTTTGDVAAVNNPPIISNGGGVVSYSTFSFGNGGSQNHIENFNNTNAALVAGKYTMTLNTPNQSKDVKVWYDFPGTPVDFTKPAAQTFASLYLIPNAGFATIVGESVYKKSWVVFRVNFPYAKQNLLDRFDR